MHRRLRELGDQLQGARHRAERMIHHDQGLSSWLASGQRDGHRERIGRSEARELMPEVRVRENARQRQVEAFVRSFLQAFGAQIVHEAPGFVSARLPEELRPDFPDRETLHLAFDRDGLTQHPDAELCAVGTEVFEEFLIALRLRGDLTATVPVLPELATTPRLAHAGSVRLVSRSLRHGPSRAVQAVWRTTLDDGKEKIVTVRTGSAATGSLPRRPLHEAEHLPEAFGPIPTVLAEVEGEAIGVFGSAIERATRRRTAGLAKERQRLEEYYRAQIAEREQQIRYLYKTAPRYQEVSEEVRQLERAWTAQHEAFKRELAPTLQAKLLTLMVAGGDDLEVVEVWEHESGRRREIVYPYAPGDPPASYASDDGSTVTVLALCADGHLVDADGCRRCGSCRLDRCRACAEKGTFGACLLCDAPTCWGCRSRLGGMCTECATPVRAPEADATFCRTWILGGGRRLLVGERSAMLVGGREPCAFVVDADLDDPVRKRARALAAASARRPAASTGARARNRRHQSRAVVCGTSTPAATGRRPTPAATRSSAPPITSTTSSRRSSANDGSSAWETRHEQHLARRTQTR